MTKKRILIVEDETITALDEEQIMHNLGYEVTGIAMTGEDAIRQAGDDKPDLVLMDIKLAGKMDGREAALKIRELHQIPVIYVTAHGDMPALRKEQSKSPKTPPPEGLGYVAKPYTKEELKSAIEKLIG